MPAVAILVAAGRGVRMGRARPKAFLTLGGEPLVRLAARAFEAAQCVESIIVVAPDDEQETARGLLEGLGKPVSVVTGGARRQDSVLEGLRAIPAGFSGVVLVHDAARPLVEPSLIESVAQAAEEAGAALPVLAMVDTVKKVRNGQVVETLDREELGTAQTPQGFRLDLLVRAYEQAFRDRVTVTDEATAVERLGVPVRAVPGSPRNRKITTAEDLQWAEGLHAPARA